MKPKTNVKRRIYLILGVVLLIVCTTGFFFWRKYKYQLVNKKLEKVTEKSRGLYQINYKNLVINEALGSITAEDIEILPDSQVYQDMVASHSQPENLFFVKIPKLSVTGVKTPKALLNKEISGHMIRLENPVVELRLTPSNKEKKGPSTLNPGTEIYKQILGKFKSITADSVVLENAQLTWVNMESKKIRCKVEGLSLRFSGIEIDSLTQNDSSRILFSNNVSLHGDQIIVPLKNEIYQFTVKGLDYSSVTGKLHTDQIRLKNRLSESAFARLHKYAVDRFDLALSSLDIGPINRSGLLRGQLETESLEMKGLSLHVFRDKSYPHDSVDRTHTYPQEAIMSLPFLIYIRNIRIRDSYIEYKEKNDKSDSSGRVSFHHVQATLSQVTNMKKYIQQNNQMQVQFNASFLDTTPFSAKILLRLNDRQGNFHMDARLGEIDAPALNALLKPMALAELNKGRIKSLRYHLDATNTKGKGSLMLQYDHLSVKILKKDDNKNKYKTKVLPTLAAGLLVKDSNPQHGKTRSGEVEYTRDIHRSIFNLMWKSLFAAIKNVVL
jgi:hypothetical protein